VSEKSLDAGRAIIQTSIARIAKRTHPDSEAEQNKLVSSLFDRISTTTDLDQALAGTDLVVEAVFEQLDAKQDLFKLLDSKAHPNCLFATDTSSLSVTEIAASCSEQRRKL